MDPFQALRDELNQSFGETINSLRAELDTIKSKSSRRPKPSLPDPDKFTGSALKFDTWLPSIKAKLRIDGEAIGDSVAQFYYVYLNLDSSVQAMVLPQLMQAEESELWDYNTILNQLSRVYDNPNKIQEAEDKLLSLRQDSDPIAVYIAKFERILYEARGQDWPDVTKISTFRKGLNTTLRNRLVQQLNLPRTYPEFLRVVQQLAGHSFSSPVSNPLATTTNAARNIKPTDAMDLSTVSINNLQLDPAPKSTSYKDQGRCLRCGASEHWVKNCPFPKPVTKAPEHRLWAENELKALEARYEDSNSDSDSE
jgi:hypothetical protein